MKFENIEYIVSKPSNFDETVRYPTVIFMHGAGTRGADLQKVPRNPFFGDKNVLLKEAIVYAPLCNSDGGNHIYNRTACIGCGECVTACLGEVLSLCGKEMTVDEVFDIVMEDLEFYENSGGGVTLSGGECLLQADFCAELMKKLKGCGINCNVDTCGYVDKSAIDKVAPYTDVFLYDIKHIDSGLHKKYTGVPNEKIIENLGYIASIGKSIEVRIPLIPDINDDNETIEKIGVLLSGIETLKRVKLLPYNNLAGSKYENMGKKNTMPDGKPQSSERMEEIKHILENFGLKVVS